jgi:hypothetical protein
MFFQWFRNDQFIFEEITKKETNEYINLQPKLKLNIAFNLLTQFICLKEKTQIFNLKWFLEYLFGNFILNFIFNFFKFSFFKRVLQGLSSNEKIVDKVNEDSYLNNS